MDRRDFLKKSALAGAGFMASQSVLGKIVKDGIPMDKNHTALGSNATNSVQHQVFEERKLGKRKVTSIGLGTVDICPVGYYGCSTTKEDMLRLMRRAYDHGITLFDTAEVYGSEEWVGEALRSIRDKVTIETKFGFAVAEGKPSVVNSKPDHIRKA